MKKIVILKFKLTKANETKEMNKSIDQVNRIANKNIDYILLTRGGLIENEHEDDGNENEE